MRILFILLVLVLLVGCAGEVVDKTAEQGGEETGGEADTGIDDVFGEGEDIEPPPAPS